MDDFVGFYSAANLDDWERISGQLRYAHSAYGSFFRGGGFGNSLYCQPVDFDCDYIAFLNTSQALVNAGHADVMQLYKYR